MRYLVVWGGGETPAEVQGVFVTQAAAGRAIDDTLLVFVTLR